MSNNTFIGNSSGGEGNAAAGGVACYGPGIVTVLNNMFIGNTLAGKNALNAGGGLSCSDQNGDSISICGNTFIGNSSGTFGGGAYCFSPGNTATVSMNTFLQNNATSGGGIYATGQTINLIDNLVLSNSQTSSSSQGAGIWVDATSNLFMINNTVSGNTAVGSGGGAAFEVTGTVELLNVYNNIIWGNTAIGNGGDVWLGGTGQMKVFDYNDVDSIYGVWDIAQNDIDLSPHFFNPIAGDYHTQRTSPCKGAGSISAPSLPATDLDGNPRVLSGLVDMGCYEFTTSVTHPADTNGVFFITPAEYSAYAAAWQNGLTWTNGPNPGPNPIPANYVTRAGYLMTNGGSYTNDGSAMPVNWKTNAP